jgi:hypothetical protein
VVGNTRVAVGAIGVRDTRWSRASDIDACDIALSVLQVATFPFHFPAPAMGEAAMDTFTFASASEVKTSVSVKVWYRSSAALS